MLSKAKELYLRLIKGKLVNQIIFVIGIICFIQIITVCLMYLYMYHSREEEIISNNMQILHQANTNYFSGIVDDIYLLHQKKCFMIKYSGKAAARNRSAKITRYTIFLQVNIIRQAISTVFIYIPVHQTNFI